MSEILEQETEPKYIEIYIQETGDLSRIVKDFELYKGQYIDYYIDIYVPITRLPSVEGHGVAVQTALMYTKRNGNLQTTIGYNAVIKETGVIKYGRTYNVYEQRIPQVYVKHIGEQTLIANINEIDTTTDPAEFVQIITSQTCPLVIQMSDYIDDEEVPDPSQLDLLQAEVNNLILNKQDKVDTSIQTNSWQDSQTVVGAINNNTEQTELNRQQVATNTSNISSNTSRIATNEQDISSIKAEQLVQNESINTNTSDIADLKAIVGTGENYIGGMSGVYDPTIPSDLGWIKIGLNQYVRQKTDRAPQGGDVVIYWQHIEGETDKNYKFIYSGSQNDWTFYLIPGVETASNTDKGILKGNYDANDTTHKIQVNVINGDIEDVYLVDNRDEHVRLGQYINSGEQAITNLELQVGTNTTNISTLNGKVSTLENTTDNILNGTTPIGKATSADQDGNGNNIVNTYLTQTAGVTKVQLREYALPRAFNDVSYLTSTGYSDEVPTDVNPIYSETSTAVGDTELFSAEKTIVNAEFDLGAKNSSTDTIYVSASEVCNVQFRLTTEVYNDSQWHTASIELSDNVQFTTANEIKKTQFGSTFTQLSDVLKIVENDKIKQTLEVVTNTSESITFDVYSNETYPSTFYLNTTSQTIMVAQGDLGEVLTITLTGVYDSEQDTLTFDIPEGLVINDSVMAQFILTLPSGISDTTQVLFVQGNQDIITMVVPTLADNRTVPTIKDMSSTIADTLMLFKGTFEVNNGDIYLYTDITVGGDELPTNLVTTDTNQTITSEKNFQAGLQVTTRNDYKWGLFPAAGGAALQLGRIGSTEGQYNIYPLGIRPNANNQILGHLNKFKRINVEEIASTHDGTSAKVQDIIDSSFNIINASDIASTDILTDAQFTLLTNGKPTLLKGTWKGFNSAILSVFGYKESIDTWSSIIQGIRYDNYSTIGIVRIPVNTKKLTIVDAKQRIIDLQSIAGFNGKQIPAYPTDTTKQYKLAQNTSGNLVWVEDNTGGYVTLDTDQTITSKKTIKDTSLDFQNSSASGNASWQLEPDQYGQLCIWRTYNGTKSKMFEFNGNSFKPVGGYGTLGSASQKWLDVYLSRYLSDGTNSLTVADIASKDFVNSSIATNTANFIGTFASVSDLEAYSGTITNNDYAFVINGVVEDNGGDWATFNDLDAYDKTLLTNFDYAWVVNGSNFDLYRFDMENQEWVLRVQNTTKASVTLNTAYNRYKYSASDTEWLFEYTLNNSSFTAAQWEAINSGANPTNIAQIGTNASDISNLQTSKQNIIDSSNKLNADLIEDGTTNKVFTATEQTKLSGIESGAQVNTVTSVNTQTGAVVLDADDISDSATTNKFVTASEKSTWNAKQNELPTTTTAGQVLKSTSTAGTLEWGTVQSGGVTDAQVNGTSVVTNGVANIETNTAYNASTNKIATMNDIPASSTSAIADTLVKRDASGNIVGNYLQGTWLRTTGNIASGSTPGNYAVLNDGWIYSRTLAQTKSDLGLGTQATYSLSGTTLTITTL